MLAKSVPFKVPPSESKQSLSNKPFVVGGKTIFISQTLVDRHTQISPEDEKLVAVIEQVRSAIKDTAPSLKQIVDTIHTLYPRASSATAAVEKYRLGSKAKLLGEYFESEQVYDAVCIHKALLAQAVASTYGIRTELIDFGFQGQIFEGESDNISGMHAALLDEDGFVADPHKGLYELRKTYFERFDQVNIFEQGRVIFTPDPTTSV